MSYLNKLSSILIITLNIVLSNSLSLSDNGNGTWNVDYSSDTNIGGFQFDVDGATVNGASGGDAAANGFMTSTSSTTVLGFSLTGSTIPSGTGTLVVVDLTGTPTSLSGIVVADQSGSSLSFIYEESDEVAKDSKNEESDLGTIKEDAEVVEDSKNEESNSGTSEDESSESN